jgi:PKD repeat protein
VCPFEKQKIRILIFKIKYLQNLIKKRLRMKKLLFTFSLVIAMSSFALAQGIVNINGYVTDANGNALSGYPVEILGDSIPGINFYTMVFTNSNGYYSANATVGIVSQGNFIVYTIDSCTSNYQTQYVSFLPGAMTISNVNFSICPNGGGGSSCAASFVYQTSPSGVVTFTGFASGGQGPYTYNWSLGNGIATSGQTVTAIYNGPGVYLPCLTITDATGCTSTYCDSLLIGGGGTNCSASFLSQANAIGGFNFTSTVGGTAGAVSYFWDFGDGSTSSLANPTHTYAFNGVYTACLTIVDANGCTSTYCSTIVNGSGSSCSAAMNVSTNNMFTATFSATATGTAPFTYVWDFGDSIGTSTMANPSYTYAGNGFYHACVIITDANGCTAIDCYVVVIDTGTVSAGSLDVFVFTDTLSFTPKDAVVYLIQYDSLAGTLTAVQTDTAQGGIATFNNIPYGDYLVKAALLPTDPDYTNYLPTYYTKSLNWSGATNMTLGPNMVGFTYIELIKGSNIGTGPGFIGGLVTQGANGPGDPLEGILVILYDASMNPIGYTYTDEDGLYSFDNLPYGVYYVYIDALGLISAPVEVTLSPTTPTMNQVQFEITTQYVMFTSTNETLPVAGLKVFPNPVTNELYMQFDFDQVLDAQISVVNITGQTLMNFEKTLSNGTNLIQVPANELPAGIYTISLTSKAGVITQKFIKQ